jgi:hypothetical protein
VPSKKYYKKKNKENYEKNKIISKEYQASKNFINKTFTEFKKDRKKHLGQ